MLSTWGHSPYSVGGLSGLHSWYRHGSEEKNHCSLLETEPWTFSPYPVTVLSYPSSFYFIRNFYKLKKSSSEYESAGKQ